MVRGEWAAPERRAETVGEWAERWLAQGQWQPQTKRSYAETWVAAVAPRWRHVPIGDVTRESIREWVGELQENYAQRTVRYAVSTLGRVLAAAVETGALPSNPCSGLRLAGAPQRPMCVLGIAQVEALAAEIARPVLRPAGHGARSVGRTDRPDLALWVRLATYCGLRAGELAALRREDIDLHRKVVIVDESIADVAGKLVVGTTKTGHRRAVPIPSSLLPALRRHLAAEVGAEPRAPVFTNGSGGTFRHAAVYRSHFRPAVERAGLPPELRFHDLRHSYAALLIAEGAHPRAIMERMGHSSITVTLGTAVTPVPRARRGPDGSPGSDHCRAVRRCAYCTDIARSEPARADLTRYTTPDQGFFRAGGGTRTHGLTITSRLRFQLRHTGGDGARLACRAPSTTLRHRRCVVSQRRSVARGRSRGAMPWATSGQPAFAVASTSMERLLASSEPAVISTLRGLACSATGTRTLRTPFS